MEETKESIKEISEDIEGYLNEGDFDWKSFNGEYRIEFSFKENERKLISKNRRKGAVLD